MTREENAGETKAPKKSTNRHGNKEKLKPPTKIVIRHLPPTMTEEEFLKQIDPLPPHDFYYYAAADWSLGFDATCRAYLTVKNYDDVYLFRDRFDGYVFVDAKGAEYPAIVEFAPFQGLVKNKSRRTDNKVNTIEEEAHYQQFLVKLEEEREAVSKGGECKLEFNLNIKKEEITSTPLLQYLANKKEKRRQEAKKRTEEKKRQREDEREKRRVAAQAKQAQQPIRIIATKADGQTEATKHESDQSKENKNKENNKENDKDNNNKENNVNKNKSVAESAEDKDKLNARAKRRLERNQRRHDDYLQRKQNERASKDAETVKVESATEQKKDNSEQKVLDKEKSGRRERDRERERERNRARRERERQKNKATSSAKNDERKTNGSERTMSGTSQDVPNTQSKDKLSQEKSQHNNNKNTENDIKHKQNNEEQQRKLRAAEEKRIRNKDRPSIAIYQPKARLRLSEESDNGGNGIDSEASRERSVEKSKTEEIPLTRKVSRYSERRNERRAAAKEKEKSIPKADKEQNKVSEVKKTEINEKN